MDHEGSEGRGGRVSRVKRRAGDGDSVGREDNTLSVDSIVFRQFGGRIRSVAEAVIASSGLAGAAVKVQDRGALECTLRARLETAIERALGRA
jgi:citrate lyase subunit gamma (acyl carrier protein)